ncbi:MAG: hypothetical protein Q4E75_00935 [bacterium]|nr:hypothetical protein [bacterium]
MFIDIDEIMTLYERRMQKAQDNDRVIFYDYLSYKRAAGWWIGFINDDWNRPCRIKRAKYNSSFLKNLPDYYFLGFPIKDLLKSCYSGGYCHACAIALSLCFDDFEIITCNLKNYATYYNKESDTKINEFEHTFIVINLDGIKTVIDTTWGMITDFETYKHIFDINKIRRISSEDLKSTEIYKYIETRKYDVGPSKESEYHEDETYKKYSSMLHEYMDMCKNYSNPDNEHLQDFINRCLYKTSNSKCLYNWRTSQYFKSIIDYRIQYPSSDLFSLTDDEFDFTLESPYEETRKRNRGVLENYHKDKIEETKSQDNKLKSKVLKLVKAFKEYYFY